MKLITKKPWWWFITGRRWGEVAMTWGNNVYCAEDKWTPRIRRHEECHVRQHKGSNWVAFYHLVRSTFSEEYYNKLEDEAKKCE
jgi:hypothetical protein